MKRLLLGLLLISPAMAIAADADADSSIGAKCRAINNHRVTAGVKAAVQAVAAGYSLWRVYKTGGDLKEFKTWATTERSCKQGRLALDKGMLTGGWLAAGFFLARAAVQNAKHALALK